MDTIYGVIAICNIVIQADHASLEGSQAAISQTVGEAYALRALAHFDLLREYGQHFYRSRWFFCFRCSIC